MSREMFFLCVCAIYSVYVLLKLQKMFIDFCADIVGA